MRGWRFTGQEFDILWSAYGRDRLPYPLAFRPTTAVDWEDLVRQREAAIQSLLGQYSENLELALSTLLEPETRVESKGFGGSGLTTVFRFHGAVRNGSGATLVQLPGTAEDTGGDVIIGLCAPNEVAAAAVAALPKTPAGSRPAVSFRREEIATDRQRYSRRPNELSINEQLSRMFKRDRTAVGEITVFPGPAMDSRPTNDGRGFLWADYADDGRYYIKSGDPIVATPMSPTAMTNEIARLVDLTHRHYRMETEQNNTTW
ncbi:ESAT-6 protein secretion system EspG family protein [Nocardia tenerifensis]|uniref:ESAT-6 protein secretion system EspG family protein n=1 Tax=Nocardia tenerifensis TaxID=228006 RepID=A0A318JVA7_9NOCA|nr:ESX secretion-associated protein EspG [Nocardia tenerifensis]PXX59874.1 ESAT-6 protein secretion system EspG family protein [Nocardia tenerifensis]